MACPLGLVNDPTRMLGICDGLADVLVWMAIFVRHHISILLQVVNIVCSKEKVLCGVPTLIGGLQMTGREPSTRASRAIEPLVRSAIQTLVPDERFGCAEFVGSFWNRDSSVEVDLVGGRDQATSEQIDFVGSIKWRERGEFDRSDLSRLIQHRALIPGATDETLLVGVSRSGFSVDGLDIRLGPEDILAAFSARP
jgi:hypothetical protein